MHTCECTFGETGKLYTYLTTNHYPIGTQVFAEVGDSDVRLVTVRGNHPTPAYLNPKITYRWLLGTPLEIRSQSKLRRESIIDSTIPVP